MELCGLPKARPIVWSDCPAFQRHHRSVICAAESLTRFPWAIDTTSEKKIYIRWCCTDLLRPPRLKVIEMGRPRKSDALHALHGTTPHPTTPKTHSDV